MKPATWRALILTVCAAGTVLLVIAFLDQFGMAGSPPWYGIWGGYFAGSSQPYHLSFRGVDPGGPAALGGMRDGDLVDVRDQPLLARVWMLGQPVAGAALTFHPERGSTRARAIVVPGKFSFSRFWNYALWELTSLWLMLFAALIAWRRPYADNNLLLSTVLVCAAIGFVAEPIFFAWPWVWPYVALAVVSQVFSLSIALWVALASCFARPVSLTRRIGFGICLALVAVAIVTGDGTPDRTSGLAPILGTITLWFDPTIFIGPMWTIPINAAILAALLCSVLAIVAARGVERQRAAWLLLPLAGYYLMLTVTTLVFHFLSYQAILDTGQLYSVVALVAPLLLTYAALNRRLIDIGFVLNRTVVFATVSTIVIGIFVLVEWAASEWFVNASHSTSVMIGAFVALALGLSMRFIHKYVDRFVDRVFFHKRHDDESALRRFAHESSYINDSATLLQRALQTVRDHTTAESADIFVRNGSANYVSAAGDHSLEVGENDPAIVALSAWNKPLDLQALIGSQLPGELAFPMMSRGRLVGALVCGPKRDGETYAPDESDALLVLAHGVGGALDVLDAKSERPGDAALAELRDSVRALAEATRILPDAIADRLLNQQR